jgi:AMP nucleosidase
MAGYKRDRLLGDYPEISLGQDAEKTLKARRRIALDTLSRYAGCDYSKFQKFILLTNFPNYVNCFAEKQNVAVFNGPVLNVAHDPDCEISIIDYRVGAPLAALVVDVLSYLNPMSVIMLGLCGGLHKKQKVGDFLLPIAAIRDEGVSRHYMPSDVPSLPAFMVQKYISEELIAREQEFLTGVLHTTDYRMWEFDPDFRTKLNEEKASAIDMECSALFTAGFAHKVPVGALMLISDLPLHPKGIKTRKLATRIFKKYTDIHLSLGIACLSRMRKAVKESRINFRRFQF